ncbi:MULTISPECIES: DUF190 domain-containing protein [unclassified Sporolactobacillus]|uniref:DUF190 domain-containing protein n=1 Tax=unclassified Sporolactobacillus TaxID=2628533 RepID=UPI002368B6E4|nr:DUF190 domain-containing protein [Sporolactobacillus sp. CQH2019]MDD9150229.1 DUF190 domain-containing protein [Sporolactobacillus sp. CQH2019]
MDGHQYFTVKVYTKEENSWFRKEEYEKVLSFFQERKACWTSVTQGLVGYGRDRVIRKQSIFSFSKKTPIVVETVVPADHLPELLSGLRKLVKNGAIFTTPVQLIVSK